MTARFVKYGVSLIVALGIVAPIPARPATEAAAVSLSGPAVSALVTAYKTLRIGSLRDAPLLLRADMVVISQFGRSFIVSIGKPPTKDVRRVVIDIRTGDVISAIPPGYNPPGGDVPLPGFVAGQIIAVYDYALSDSTLTTLGLSLVRRGSYYLRIDTGFDEAFVAFIALHETPAPDGPILRPAATCVSILCPGQIGYYDIEVGESVTIERKL